MSMGSSEGFKDYTQKWIDLAGRLQPPLYDRELVDMFLGTLSGPFFNHLIGSSSAGFTELILTGERVEADIKSGKILMVASSNAEKKPFGGKREANVVYGQEGRARGNHNPSVGAVLVSNPTLVQQHQQENQHKKVVPKRQFIKINMSLAQALQHMLKAGLITLKAPLQNPNTSAPSYHLNERCAYHSDSPGHDTNSC